MKIRLLLASGAVLALLLVWFVAGRLHRFAYWIGRKTDAEVQALQKNGWQIDRLPVAPGVELVGLVRPPRSRDGRWLLFVPGNSEGLLAGFQQVLDDLRRDEDVGLAVWAYRGFEASGGSPTPAALIQDLDAQWRRLQQLGAVAARTEIWGYSLGSMLAPHLAAAMCAAGSPPRRLVLLATGTSIPIMPFGFFGRFGRSDVFEPTAAIDRITCPVVIVHGVVDDALPIEGARELARRFGDRATLHELPGRGHVDLWAEARELVWAN